MFPADVHTVSLKSFERLSHGGRERCSLGGKQRVRCCHLISTPQFRQTPNEAKGGSPYGKLLRLLVDGLFIKFLGVFDKHLQQTEPREHV